MLPTAKQLAVEILIHREISQMFDKLHKMQTVLTDDRLLAETILGSNITHILTNANIPFTTVRVIINPVLNEDRSHSYKIEVLIR